jgi:chaperonin GroEL
LKGGLAVIYIGGKTNVSTRERYDLADDAFNACKAALSSGILPGGGTALAKLKKNHGIILQTIMVENGKDSAYYLGAKAFVDSLDAVFNRIVSNAGLDSRKVFQRISGNGLDAYTYNLIGKMEFNPLIQHFESEFPSDPENKIVIGEAEKLGVIDPEYVIENEVLNAADCAGLLTSLTSITVNTKSDNSIAEAISNLG